MGVSLIYGKDSWDGTNSGGTLQGKATIISSKSFGETYFFVYNGEYGSPNCSVAFVSKSPNGAGSYSFWDISGTAGLVSADALGYSTDYGYITTLGFSSWEGGQASYNLLGTGWSVRPKAYILKNGWNLHDVGAIVYGHPDDATTVDVVDPFTTKWKLYIDGTKLPNYKLLWDNNKASENAVIHVLGIDNDILTNTPKDAAHDENVYSLHDECKITYKEFNALCGNLPYDEGIGSLLPKSSGWLGMYIEDGNKKSSTMVIQLFPKATNPLSDGVPKLYYDPHFWNSADDGSTLTIVDNCKTPSGEDAPNPDKDDEY